MNLDHATVRQEPFPHVVLPDFLEAPTSVSIAQTLKQSTFERRVSDLFSFSQTTLDHPRLQRFLEGLNNKEFRTALSKLLEVGALTHLDATGFCYQDTDHLLPHDDRMPGRKVAYIIHFSTLKNQGGQLDLYAGKEVVRSYTPQENTAVFFPVSDASLHQVREVINAERYTIAGWFYGR